jgi:hypothetical protein
MHFRFVSLFIWCENTRLALWIKGATWVFAIIETIHIIGLTLLLGTIVIVDFRLLGLGMRKQTVGELAGELSPWTSLGLVLMILTGIPMFVSEAVRLYSSGPFYIKMAFLLLAVSFHFTLHRKAIASWTKENAWRGRIAACVSLTCWLGVALAGRVIAFLP